MYCTYQAREGGRKRKRREGRERERESWRLKPADGVLPFVFMKSRCWILGNVCFHVTPLDSGYPTAYLKYP